MGEVRDAFRILDGHPEGKNRSEYLGVDGRIALKWLLNK
jgi:hypothetical protein